jgi:hypothetical protein
MSTIIEFCNGLARTFQSSIDATHVDQLRRLLTACGLLPRSSGRSYHEVTPRDAAIIVVAMGLTGKAREIETHVARLTVAVDKNGTPFVDALTIALSEADADSAASFIHIRSITVSSTSPYAVLEFGRLAGPSDVWEFGNNENKPLENYARVSPALIQWAGSCFQNKEIEAGKQISE